VYWGGGRGRATNRKGKKKEEPRQRGDGVENWLGPEGRLSEGKVPTVERIFLHNGGGYGENH